MSYKTRTVVLILLLTLSLGVVACWAFEFLPPLPSQEEYGTILLGPQASTGGYKSVPFSHWRHRIRFTCRVCHTELGITMGTSTVSAGADPHNDKRLCAACHNGTIAFAVKDSCERCHTGNVLDEAQELEALKKALPVRNSFGNGVNWVELLRKGMITPRATLEAEIKNSSRQKTITIETGSGVPPVVFPHRAHTDWIDCSSCHPALFSQGKDDGKEYKAPLFRPCRRCGVCHVRVAFPFNDCPRCHPGMKEAAR